MTHKKITIIFATIFISTISHQFHIVSSKLLEDENERSDQTELESSTQEDYDEEFLHADTESHSQPRIFFKKLKPNTNFPIDALNNNQVIFGNILPNSNSLITNNSEKPLGQTQPLPDVGQTQLLLNAGQTPPLPNVGQTQTLPDVGQTQPLPNVGQTPPLPNVGQTQPLPNVGQTQPLPDVSQIQPLPNVGQTQPLPNVGQTSSLPHVGQTQSLTNAGKPLNYMDQISALHTGGNIVPKSNAARDGVNNNQILFGNYPPNSNSMVSTSNLSNAGGIQSPSYLDPFSLMQNNLVNDKLKITPVNGAAINNVNGATPMLLLGTQQALLIPLNSLPSIFQNMLSGLMTMKTAK